MPILEAAAFAAGITALFTTVLDIFDLVIKAKKFAVDLNTLNSLLNTHKLRFYIFGVAYGIVGGSNGRTASPDPRLRASAVASVVEDNARSIFLLLEEAQKIVESYGKSQDVSAEAGGIVARPAGFRQSLVASMQRAELLSNGFAAVKWSAHHCERFNTIVSRVRGLVSVHASLMNGLSCIALAFVL